jgi:hypothetical protein
MAEDKQKAPPARPESPPNTAKRSYTPPLLTVYGNLRQITMTKGGTMMEDPMPKTKL